MSDEIKYLAVVQVLGTVEEEQAEGPSPVISRGFSNHLDAIRWVRDHVETAHEEMALVVPSITKLVYDFGGQPVRLIRWLHTIITSGGPTWGMVIENAEVTEELATK